MFLCFVHSHTLLSIVLTSLDCLVHCVAIIKRLRPIRLEIQTHRLHPVGILRSSFRQKGKVMHSSHGRITGLELERLKLIQAAFAGQALPKGHPDAFQIVRSRECGASRAVLQLAQELELDLALCSKCV